MGVGDIPCQGRPPFPRGIVPNSRKLSGFPECDRNEINAGVEEERDAKARRSGSWPWVPLAQRLIEDYLGAAGHHRVDLEGPLFRYKIFVNFLKVFIT
jgi:hypothetical protein